MNSNTDVILGLDFIGIEDVVRDSASGVLSTLSKPFTGGFSVECAKVTEIHDSPTSLLSILSDSRGTEHGPGQASSSWFQLAPLPIGFAATKMESCVCDYPICICFV
ncbi:hypothetical protein Q3G72_006171 [Acer saccharum]|nr:hypothetical protein Q3G72_006171 [Acer saccharum]